MMSEHPFSDLGIDPFIANWMKLTNTAIGEFGNHWQQFNRSEKTGNQGKGSGNSLESLLKTWRMVSSTFSNPETVSSNIAGLGEMPTVMLKFAQSQADVFSRVQQQMIDRIKNSKTDTRFFGLGLLDQQFYAGWKTFYEQELSKYLNIPQLGLTRFHQEKFNQLMDKYHLMQTTIAEFMALLSNPMERSFRKLQDKYLELAEQNELSDDAKDYYQLWIQILERDFNEFFKSSEYLTSLTSTLGAMAEFKSKRDEIIQDFLSDLPIPSDKEMNELYKEIYRLKKRVRDLEKAEARSNS